MTVSKVAITLDEGTLHLVDKLVQKRVYPNRSRVIQEAVAEKLARIDKSRLARECAKLEPREERALAEEGMSDEVAQWPAY
jgi:metal-responsive CopG/Arc/MetJ family transcriptional regulator